MMTEDAVIMKNSDSKLETDKPPNLTYSLSTIPGGPETIVMIVINSWGTIVGVSRDCETLTGYRCDELTGRRIDLIFSELFEVRQMPAALRDFDASSDVETETLLNSKNAGARPVVVRVSRIVQSGGELGYAIVVARSKAAGIANLFECGSGICLVKEEYEDNLLVAIHDTRGPLATIRGYLKMLQSSDIGVARSQMSGMVRGALGAADRMEDILRLLTEHGSREGDGSKKYVFLSDLAKRASYGLDHGLRSSHSSLVIENLGSAYVNPDEIAEVFQNLIENAMRYGHAIDAPARVRIYKTPSIDEKMVQIVVRDSGPGILPRDRDRIFEAFQRSGDPHRDALGVGLAICKRYVSNNGGSIWVETSEGGGSKFVFTLPRRRFFS